MNRVYYCPYAERRPNKVLIFCSVSGDSCGFQRYCPVKGKTILTEGCRGCTVREKTSETGR